MAAPSPDPDVLRICLVQMEHGADVATNLAQAREHLAQARDGGARLALLPEYFFAAPAKPSGDAADEVRRAVAQASADLGIAIGANVLETRDGKLHNYGILYHEGRLILEQPKVHPMPREAENGVTPGTEFHTANLHGIPTGLLVCADILYPEAARILALQGAQLLLNPVMSPYNEHDVTKGARDSIFIARAYDSGAFVLKTGGHRNGTQHRVAGRSLAAAPWGILTRAQHDFQTELLYADLDFNTLRRFRKGQENFPPRRPEAYRPLIE